MGMNKKQYNNVINWTLKQEQSTQANNSLELAKAIFNNMGVALPNGTLPEVCEVLEKQTSEIAAAERMGMQFYTYAASATTTITPEPEPEPEPEPTVPMMTNIEYYNNIHNTPLIPASGGTTYCNIWLHNMLDRCDIPYPTGGCTAELEAYQKGYDQWKTCDFQEAQSYANAGHAAIGITKYHVVAVTPNNIPPRSGSVPSKIGDVLVSQSELHPIC